MAVEPQMQRPLEEQLAGYVASSFKAAHLGNIAGQSAGLINKVTAVMILWIGATLVMKASCRSVSDRIQHDRRADQRSDPATGAAVAGLPAGPASRCGAWRYLNTPTEPGCNPGRATLPELEGCRPLDHVNFRYAPERPQVLNAISILWSGPGRGVGIVGQIRLGQEHDQADPTSVRA